MQASVYDYEDSDEEGEAQPTRAFDRIIRFGVHKNKTVSQICRSKEGRHYLRWALSTLTKLDEPTKRAMNEQLQVYDLYKKNKD